MFPTTVSSILSILGSSVIVYVILSNSTKNRTTEKSANANANDEFFDILVSLAWVIPRLAMPSDIGVRKAVGNSFTCTAQAICVWLGFAVPF